jgi:hypothetical protein
MITHHPRSVTGPMMNGARFVLLEPGTGLVLSQRRRVAGWTSTDLDYFGSGITDLPSWYSASLFVNGSVNGTPREAIERVRQTVTG